MANAGIGRREANKKEKLDRITRAARTLFNQRTVDEVSTSDVSKMAGVAAGTLFLYAKSKGELLLLAQNANYRDASLEGMRASEVQTEPTEALIALFEPIVRCNRAHVDNGRRYLQEVMFGETTHTHRKEAISLMATTEQTAVSILTRLAALTDSEAELMASSISAVLFLTLASPLNAPATIDQLLASLKSQIGQLLK